ncbi:uncharacterized protein At5g39570 isoform X1 [Arachis stenosperma]|uniref:uncharacterized protein At5g39570 isoform X1 n=1 Tax=Arachis stenosperma TaxID=217475 RepID=UPI0025AC7579|nr:uncharacterized protein At5g39570 isoform X1 [Arachis stenosperma]
MAYYSYPYSDSDYGEYNFNSYASTYNYTQVPTFNSYNSYEYNKPYYGYDQSLYLSANYPYQSYQTSISYSATNFTDPKSFEYDPNHGMTQLVISYNTVESNIPEFDEYDPTPYGGGYDIAETYGKPLPPSDEICYPPSTGSSSIAPPADAVPAGPIVPLPLPTVDEAIDEKAILPQKEAEREVTQEMPQSQESSKDQEEVIEDKDYDTSEESESDDEDDRNNYSGSGYGNGYSGGKGDEYEKKVPAQYPPSGYGLEAMDLCETLFGYWPCLSRMKREHRCEAAPHRGNYYCQENIWKGTADYLFGNPYPYSGRGEEEGSGYGHVGGGGEVVHSYERHYPTQAHYRQSEYTDGSSW